MRTLLVLILLPTLAPLLPVQPPGARGDSNSYGVDFLDQKEKLVRQLGDFALENYLNSQGLGQTCYAPSNCSRRVCSPLLSDLDSGTLTCKTVPQNPNCNGPNNSVCTTIRVSLKQSYVRWPPDAQMQSGPPTCDMRSTVCAQRELDEQIFTRSNTSDFKLQAYMYFGASNGIDRIYPGKQWLRKISSESGDELAASKFWKEKIFHVLTGTQKSLNVKPERSCSTCSRFPNELNETSCSNYELRERPWFVGATAVEKELVVMLDAGPAMGSVLGLLGGNHAKVFDASRNITLRLLNTLFQDDKISVFTFPGSGSSVTDSAPIGPKVTVRSTASGVDLASLEPVRTLIQNLSDPETSGDRKPNLTAALTTARDQFDHSSQQLKMMVIITAGDLVGEYIDPELVQSLANITVFIYRLQIFLGPARQLVGLNPLVFQNLSCILNGSHEEGQYDPRNPLWTVQSFYSYVAKARFDQNDQKPYWVPQYPAHSGIGDLITVAYPVFNGSFLVGVAGVDLLVDNLGALSSSLNTLLSTRNMLESLIISNPPRITCGQTLVPRLQNDSCPAPVLNNSSLTEFCTDVDPNPDSEERFCCKEFCPWSHSHGSGLSKVETIGIIVASIVGGILVIAGLFWLGIFHNICIVLATPFLSDDQTRRSIIHMPRDGERHHEILSMRTERYYEGGL